MFSSNPQVLILPFFPSSYFLRRKMIKSQAFWIGCNSFFVFYLFFIFSLSFIATRNTGDMRNNSNKHPNSLAKIDVPRV